ncbi:hypothetical protein EIK77_005849 [Talaromyces pinophilus]|nr:hypothetical protein EIK77_005849 [Talaromyces pinophilus]
MGHKFNNAQLIADQFAANGFFVFMPDLFHGDPVQLNRGPDFDFAKWLQGHGPATADPIKIAAVGYCFGAKYVVRHLHPKQNKIDVGYVAHPSFIEADELKAIGGPFSISAAETDTIFPAEKRHESEIILKETGLPYQINLYSGVEHGFAVRAELSNKVAKYAKENAFLQALAWFEEHLKN